MKVQLFVLLILVVYFVSVYGQAGDTPQVYCGRRLAQTMAVLCYQNYEKRSGSDYNSIRLGYEPELPSWSWFSAARGLNDRPHLEDRSPIRGVGARGKRGIIEDCCEQSCSISTLLSYC